MLITGKNLRLTYYDRKNHVVTDVKLKKRERLAYNLFPGQQIRSITYYYSSNEFLEYDIEVKEVSKEGVLFLNWHKEEIFYSWERDIKSYKGETERAYIVIKPCEHLYENPTNAQKLISGEVKHNEGLWYKHGGDRTGSRYEKNLKYFTLLGQQSLF